MRFVWILSLSATTLAAQHLRLGVVGGTGLTSDYSTYFMPGGTVTLTDGSIFYWLPITTRTGSRSPIGGPTIEWHFTDRFSLEGSAVYRRLRLESGGPTVTWEFPALLKYRLLAKPITPFIEAGPSLRTTGNRNTNPSHYGASAGAGLDVEWQGFRISPTIRYTRWAAGSHNDYGIEARPGGGASGVQSRSDQ